MLCQVKTYSPIKGLARGYGGLKSIKEGCVNAFMRGLKKNQIRKIKKFGQDGLFTCTQQIQKIKLIRTSDLVQIESSTKT